MAAVGVNCVYVVAGYLCVKDVLVEKFCFVNLLLYFCRLYFRVFSFLWYSLPALVTLVLGLVFFERR